MDCDRKGRRIVKEKRSSRRQEDLPDEKPLRPAHLTTSSCVPLFFPSSCRDVVLWNDFPQSLESQKVKPQAEPLQSPNPEPRDLERELS